jgi:hypothetical protein
MRSSLVVMLAAALFLGDGSVALANKVPCKQIKEAIASGKTPEEVAKDLGTRPKRVAACTSGNKKKARKKKEAEAAQAPTDKQAPAGDAGKD